MYSQITDFLCLLTGNSLALTNCRKRMTGRGNTPGRQRTNPGGVGRGGGSGHPGRRPGEKHQAVSTLNIEDLSIAPDAPTRPEIPQPSPEEVLEAAPAGERPPLEAPPLEAADKRPIKLVFNSEDAQTELPYNYHPIPPYTWTPWDHGKVNVDQYGTFWYDPKPATIKAADGTVRPKLDKKIYSKNTDKFPEPKPPPLYSDSLMQTAPWKRREEYGEVLSKRDYHVGDVICAVEHGTDYDTTPPERSDMNRTDTAFGVVYSKQRKYVVLQKHHDHCLTLPIFTFGGNGLQRKPRASRENYLGIRDVASKNHLAPSENDHELLFSRRRDEMIERLGGPRSAIVTSRHVFGRGGCYLKASLFLFTHMLTMAQIQTSGLLGIEVIGWLLLSRVHLNAKLGVEEETKVDGEEGETRADGMEGETRADGMEWETRVEGVEVEAEDMVVEISTTLSQLPPLTATWQFRNS
ncbi:hypothetical protein NHQ30_001343 [Ciborinia camelliae]|nr:hypothetical protein NHQ30_001343 [Ciborinia camelliae]